MKVTVVNSKPYPINVPINGETYIIPSRGKQVFDLNDEEKKHLVASGLTVRPGGK